MKRKAANWEQVFHNTYQKKALYHNLFIHSPIDGHLGSCQLLVSMYDEHSCYGHLFIPVLMVKFLLDKYLVVELLGHRESIYFILYFSKQVVLFYILTSSVWRGPPGLHPHLVLHCFSFDHPDGNEMYFGNNLHFPHYTWSSLHIFTFTYVYWLNWILLLWICVYVLLIC